MSDNPYGKNVLRVSEIAGALKPDIKILLFWAAMKGFKYEELIKRACDIGNVVHMFAEAALAKNPALAVNAVAAFKLLNADDQEQATNAQLAFQKWVLKNDVQPLYLEQKMDNFTRKEDPTMPRIGGTCDFIGYVNGELTMVDWKSSRHLSRAYGVQLAGYKYLFEHNWPDHPPIKRFFGLRLDKELAWDEYYEYTPWIEEAEWRFRTQADLVSKWEDFTNLEY